MRKTGFFIIFLFTCLNIWAADVPEIVDLGFSADNKYYMFGYYGVDSETAYAYAEFFIVDVAKNNFTSDGTFQYKSSTVVSPGFDAMGALLNLYDATAAARKKYQINPLNQGRLVYVLLNGAVPEQTVKFRDFQGKIKYEISIDKSISTTVKESHSSFSMTVNKTDDAAKTSIFKAGNPSIVRAEVVDYQIKKIILSPNEQFMVILVSKYYSAKEGGNIRFMVETLSLK